MFDRFNGSNPEAKGIKRRTMAGKVKKRFGMVAVEKGYVDRQDVLEALKIQLIENMNGKGHRRVGVILAQLGLITKSQIEDMLESMIFT